MPINSYVLGQKQVDFAKVEVTYDTLQAFAAGDALKLLSLKLTPEYSLEDTKEHTASGSRNGVLPGAKGGKWQASGYWYLLAAGSPPECAPFLQAGYHKETIVGGTSVTYSFDNTQTPKSLQLAHLIDTNVYEVATGCMVESFAIKRGGERPTWEASGTYATHGWATACEVAAAGALIGASTFPILAAHAGSIGVNAVIQIGTYSNAGVGYTVTAVSADGQTVTIAPVLEAAVTSGMDVLPLVPTPTYAGTLLGLGGSAMTLGGRTVRYSEHTTTITTGRHPLIGEGQSDKPAGVIPGKVLVDGTLGARFVDTDYGPFVGRTWAGAGHAVVDRVGPSTAGAHFKVNAPNVIFDVPAHEFPDEGETSVSLKYRAHQSAAEYDEHTLVFD
jgi:hypothetical protein